MNNNKDYLKVAVSAAKQASKTFSKNFGKPKNVKLKNNDPRNMVTEIDRGIETQIRKTLKQHFPHHKIIGEEFGAQEVNKNDFVWALDPIDGTTNYIQGLPICCISIGLWQSNTPLVGVVYNPTLNQLFTAAKGQGAFLNGKKIRVSDKAAIRTAYGGFGWGHNIQNAQLHLPKLLPLMHKIRTLGSATYEMCLIAMGVFDFHIQSEINFWDFAAATVIVMEAGGQVTEMKGGKLSLDSKSFFASNGRLHKKMVQDIKKTKII